MRGVLAQRDATAGTARAHACGVLPVGPAEVRRRLEACCLDPEPVESWVSRREGEVSSRSAARVGVYKGDQARAWTR